MVATVKEKAFKITKINTAPTVNGSLGFLVQAFNNGPNNLFTQVWASSPVKIGERAFDRTHAVTFPQEYKEAKDKKTAIPSHKLEGQDSKRAFVELPTAALLAAVKKHGFVEVFAHVLTRKPVDKNDQSTHPEQVRVGSITVENEIIVFTPESDQLSAGDSIVLEETTSEDGIQATEAKTIAKLKRDDDDDETQVVEIADKKTIRFTEFDTLKLGIPVSVSLPKPKEGTSFPNKYVSIELWHAGHPVAQVTANPVTQGETWNLWLDDSSLTFKVRKEIETRGEVACSLKIRIGDNETTSLSKIVTVLSTGHNNLPRKDSLLFEPLTRSDSRTGLRKRHKQSTRNK